MGKIYSDRGDYLGSIRSNGEMYDEHGDYLGRIDSNGYIYDYHGKYQGAIWENGHIYINGSYVGLIDENGNVYSEGNYAGHIEGYREIHATNTISTAKSSISNKGSESPHSKGRSSNIPTSGSSSSMEIGEIGNAFLGGLLLVVIMIVISIIQFGLRMAGDAFSFLCSPGAISVIGLAFATTCIIEMVNPKKINEIKKRFVYYVLINFGLFFLNYLCIMFIFNADSNNTKLMEPLFMSLFEALLMSVISLGFFKGLEKWINADKARMKLFIGISIIVVLVSSGALSIMNVAPYKLEYVPELVWPTVDEDTNDNSDESEDLNTEYDDSSSGDESEYSFMVNSSATQDYSQLDDIDDFNTTHFNGITIGYPKDFYNDVLVLEDELYLKGSNGQLVYYFVGNTQDYADSVLNYYDEEYEDIQDEYDRYEMIIANRDEHNSRLIYNANMDSGDNFYNVITITDQYIYKMSIQYNDSEFDMEQKYLIDTLYCLFGKSGSSREPFDTISEFEASGNY